MIFSYNKSVKYIYFFWTLIIFINLAVKSGWDLWVQTLSFYLSLAACLAVMTKGLRVKTQFILFLALSLLFTFISYFAGGLPVVKDIALFTWINCIIFFFLGAGYLSFKKEKISRLAAGMAPVAAVMDFFYPVLFETSLFPNPNIKAAFFILTTPFLLHVLKNSLLKEKKIPFFVYTAGAGFVLASFIRASSRWGSLVLVASIITWLLFNNMKKAAAAAGAAGAAVILVFLELQSLRGAIFTRLEWLAGGIKMITHRPLTGFGPGSVPHVLPSFTGSEFISGLTEKFSIPGQSQYIHSYFIQFAAEFGLPAAVFLVLFLVFALKAILSSKDNLDTTGGISLLFLLVYNLLEYNLAIPLISLMFFSILGVYFPGKALEMQFRKFIHRVLVSGTAAFIITAAAVFAAGPFLSTRHFSMGIYELNNSNTAKAEVLFEKSLDRYPRHHLPNLGKALVAIKNTRLERAEALISKSLPAERRDINPAVKSFKTARRLRLQGRFEEAAEKYTESVSLRFKQFGYDYRLH